MSSILNNSKHTPPANEPVVGADGTANQTWLKHWQDAANAIDGKVGDYRQTSLDDAGPNWLLCDGRSVRDVDFPDLAAVMKPITGAGATSDTFVLPGIQAVLAANGKVLLATWVKAS